MFVSKPKKGLNLNTEKANWGLFVDLDKTKKGMWFEPNPLKRSKKPKKVKTK